MEPTMAPKKKKTEYLLFIKLPSNLPTSLQTM
jgi:hypothetical protein